ncbi:MAG TPA: DNA gyrase subunit A [Syntrophomonadaceae bacterium]|nr:DNA gyrase subunit A [Syntrophomonadaceae bacterium]
MAEGNLFDKTIAIDIEKEVKKSFLEYSMSVIVSRAIPDVRDGLKPVHRRILYALSDQGMTHDKPHKKSAFIVGEVMGKYHPHGDSAIYDTMVKMAQDFSMRYPLIDGHGNFGSIDGDSAAAMRYTESRMARIASELLKDIDKDTVNWRPNYDDSREEPEVLPARIPNLLINGSTGIAVGMATNIPPHNLTEILDGLTMLINNPEVTIDELIEVVKGPDFPTAGIIMGTSGIKQAYHTGRGSIRIRAKHEIIERKSGRNSIIITEIPYQVNKSRLVEKIAELVRDKKVEGIVDLRDESDRKGIRIVIDVRRDININVLINKLFRYSQLEGSFGFNMLALVHGQPQLLNLKQMLEYYLEHRKEVITRRTKYELRLALDRLHIVEGLRRAIDHLDEIIEIIRGSKDRETARQSLIAQFDFTEIQANAILDMRLAQLTGLERSKLEEEFNQLLDRIADFKDILARPERVLFLIKEDIEDIRKRYGDERRTEISLDDGEFNIEDFIDEHEVVITLSNRGYIKRQPLDTYRAQRRGGKGISATTTRTEDFVTNILVTSVLADILYFTNQGRVFSNRAFNIIEASRQARGLPLINLLELRPEEKVTTIISAKDYKKGNLIMVTRKGIIKKVALSAFENIRRNGLIAVGLREDDELVEVIRVRKNEVIMLVSAKGQSISFAERQVRRMGRTATGVIGISLDDDDYVIGMDKYRENADVLLVTENGYGKRVNLDEFKTQNRAGKGLKSIVITKRNGYLVGFKVVTPDDEIVILTNEGHIIRLLAGDISEQKRYSRGVLLMRIDKEDQISAVARFKIEEENEEEAE